MLHGIPITTRQPYAAVKPRHGGCGEHIAMPTVGAENLATENTENTENTEKEESGPALPVRSQG